MELMQFAIDNGAYLDKELFDFAVETGALHAAKFILEVLNEPGVCDERSIIRVRFSYFFLFLRLQ